MPLVLITLGLLAQRYSGTLNTVGVIDVVLGCLALVLIFVGAVVTAAAEDKKR